jgi:hypothetical protein
MKGTPGLGFPDVVTNNTNNLVILKTFTYGEVV